jgi:dethiobiotin synthetase
MPATRNRGLFITGTDTGVGKSLVAAALAKMLTERGIHVGVFKPAETGVADAGSLGPDAALLKWAAGSKQTDEQICPYRFRDPLAPAVAASREQVRIDYNNLVEQARLTIDRHDFTIIEGAGGLMVPLAGGLLMADFARAVKLPLLLVCRPNLGTINHSLLSLFFAKAMNMEVAGYLINNMPPIKTAAEETVAHSLASLTTAELLGILDSVGGSEQEKVVRLAEQLKALPTLPLLQGYLP